MLQEHVFELERLKQGLDKIEERQRRAIPPIEALLASTMDTWPEDTEDELLAQKIRKGEQARLRLCFQLLRAVSSHFFTKTPCFTSFYIDLQAS